MSDILHILKIGNLGGKMKNKIGIIREFDNLGRLVIPKEMRVLFNFKKEVEIVVTENGVLLRNPKYKLVKIESLDTDN